MRKFLVVIYWLCTLAYAWSPIVIAPFTNNPYPPIFSHYGGDILGYIDDLGIWRSMTANDVWHVIIFTWHAYLGYRIFFHKSIVLGVIWGGIVAIKLLPFLGQEALYADIIVKLQFVGILLFFAVLVIGGIASLFSNREPYLEREARIKKEKKAFYEQQEILRLAREQAKADLRNAGLSYISETALYQERIDANVQKIKTYGH
uniref:hypothetical protein n=1 Tax=Thaumasiovibrio occultus TaxID=1891184 RepID=UPI000B34B10F|nr:hypothetical protein [Thaumasiovibrio occultus]